jgi:hypothetical protein
LHAGAADRTAGLREFHLRDLSLSILLLTILNLSVSLPP